MKNQSLSIKKEYKNCVNDLDRAGILINLPDSKVIGVVGIDGKEYPIPTLKQIQKIFRFNKELVERKMLQGFNRLELTPIAIPTNLLIEKLEQAIIKHANKEKIFQTKHSFSDALIPARVNSTKHVWVWERLKELLDTSEIVYFPKEYPPKQIRQTKLDVINNPEICAVPGWSVGLVENLPIMPEQGNGKVVGSRKQLEIGCSPREYLKELSTSIYEGETGKTLEDFITKFLVQLEKTNQVSNDVDDKNALWCLGQYIKISYAQVVPTGRWVRKVGRVRLDMHRTGNKLCAPNWGVTTIVRLHRP